MGQPKFPRKKFQTPNHPWQGERIKAENEIKVKFGLKNKREIWRAQTRLREIRQQGRNLVSATRNPDDVQAATEADLLLKRLHRQGYVGKDATLNDVLGLDLERILNRRLQSQVYLKGLARTPKQARQFVSHGLIQIGERRISAPSYVVRREEEELIHIDPSKSVADEDHPIRPKPEGFEAVQERQAAAQTVQEEKPAETKEEAPPETVQEEKPAETKEAAPAETVQEEKPAETKEAAPAETVQEEKPAETKEEAPPETKEEAPVEETAEQKPEEAAPAAPEAPTGEPTKGAEAQAEGAAEAAPASAETVKEAAGTEGSQKPRPEAAAAPEAPEATEETPAEATAETTEASAEPTAEASTDEPAKGPDASEEATPEAKEEEE